ncbi:PhnE/PtxC family ABC transporter permease [Amedibacillus sp. YH-ame10]
MSYFLHRRKVMLIGCVLLLGMITISTLRLEIDWLKILVNSKNSWVRFTQEYLPMDLSVLPTQLYQLWVTIVISIAGAFVGMVLAFFSSLALSKNTGKNTILKYAVRGFASFTRNIPEAVWAILLIPFLWFGEFLGFLVMCIISYGFLTRTFADAIDEANSNCLEALEATGANYWQIIVHGVIPETMPALISWSLYAAENNIRSATVVGMLAGGGIGWLMGVYKDFYQMKSLCTAIALIVLVVIITDQISTQIRKRLL